MITKFDNAKILLENGYVYGNLEVEDGKFIAIDQSESDSYDKIIIPGFIDQHTHGGDGLDFSTVKNLDELEKLLRFYVRHGVTSVFPTLLTESDELIFRQSELIYEASKTHPEIKGIHLEGPFLSKEFKGAQLEKYLQIPTIEKCKEFIEHSHGLFKLMTIAPENPNTEEVVKFLVENGIQVTMGHSNATFDETKKAKEAGAKCLTHCFNASKGIHQHFPSITMAGLYFDDLYTEVILDGIHVHREMVEFIRKIKTNDKLIGITDSLMCAGLPNGDYMIGNTPIVVKDGDCKIKGTDTRAGSCLIMDQAFKNIKEFTKVDDKEASKMCSLNSARMLKMDDKIGSIKVGKNADFIVLDKNNVIQEVYINGEKKF